MVRVFHWFTWHGMTHIPIVVYTVPSDDEQISAREIYVEAINRNKLKENSASCWSCYTDILRCTVNETLSLTKRFSKTFCSVRSCGLLSRLQDTNLEYNLKEKTVYVPSHIIYHSNAASSSSLHLYAPSDQIACRGCYIWHAIWTLRTGNAAAHGISAVVCAPRCANFENEFISCTSLVKWFGHCRYAAEQNVCSLTDMTF
jgi:hypothetical protein